jgi:hypothetical protein
MSVHWLWHQYIISGVWSKATAGIEAGVEITLGPVWKVETAPKPIFGASWASCLVRHSLYLDSCLMHVVSSQMDA